MGGAAGWHDYWTQVSTGQRESYAYRARERFDTLHAIQTDKALSIEKC